MEGGGVGRCAVKGRFTSIINMKRCARGAQGMLVYLYQIRPSPTSTLDSGTRGSGMVSVLDNGHITDMFASNSVWAAVVQLQNASWVLFVFVF